MSSPDKNGIPVCNTDMDKKTAKHTSESIGNKVDSMILGMQKTNLVQNS
ncbi:MAG: hypothetical protein H0X50_07190 [Nitrosopumilus sp.]|nr:hypothetical protein [Nitrosopumilus sp.]